MSDETIEIYDSDDEIPVSFVPVRKSVIVWPTINLDSPTKPTEPNEPNEPNEPTKPSTSANFPMISIPFCSSAIQLTADTPAGPSGILPLHSMTNVQTAENFVQTSGRRLRTKTVDNTRAYGQFQTTPFTSAGTFAKASLQMTDNSNLDTSNDSDLEFADVCSSAPATSDNSGFQLLANDAVIDLESDEEIAAANSTNATTDTSLMTNSMVEIMDISTSTSMPASPNEMFDYLELVELSDRVQTKKPRIVKKNGSSATKQQSTAKKKTTNLKIKNIQSLAAKPGTSPPLKNDCKEMFCSHPRYKAYCVLCNKRDRHIVNHYVICHPTSEVFISRLSPQMLEMAKRRVQTAKLTKFRYAAFCYMCESNKKFSRGEWYQHLTSHTGEYVYKCNTCHLPSLRKRLSCRGSEHMCKNVKARKIVVNKCGINVFVCHLCNYVQLIEANLIAHVKRQHGIEQDEIESNYYIVKVLEFGGDDKELPSVDDNMPLIALKKTLKLKKQPKSSGSVVNEEQGRSAAEQNDGILVDSKNWMDLVPMQCEFGKF